MPTTFIAGEQLLHYRLLRQIGEGGMGVVYEAEDDRLGRTVAIKRLQPALYGEPGARERFLREARAAATLDHPNLCTIHAVEEAPNGTLLLVMALYRGQTLADLLKQGPLALPQLRDIACQAAAGLHAAHLAGIIHRDIKPANVFLLNSGVVKILDFGLSRAAHLQQITAQHQVLGTLAYMPPEQLAGHQVDHRADLWAFGVVLYEMATGRSPFQHPTPAATMAAIAAARYLPLKQARPDLPIAIRSAIEGALHRQPHERHASAAEMVALLQQSGASASENSTATHLPYPAQPAEPSASSTQHPFSIAVLPMQNVSSDPENAFFCDGLTDELISSLGTLPGLRVVSRTSVFSLKGGHLTIREIGKVLDVAVVLEGSVRRAGQLIRVSVQLTDVHQGFNLWSARFDRELIDIFQLQDDLASAVFQALQPKLPAGIQLASVPPSRSPMQSEAYETYLKGRYHWERRTMADVMLAGRYFEKALGLDESSAAVHAGLSDFYALQGTFGLMPPEEAWHSARTYAQQSIALDPNLAEGHIALANVLQFYDWNWAGARKHILKALQLRPQRGESYYIYAGHLMTQGLLEEALVQARLGLTYDPLAGPLLAAESMLLLYLGDHESARLLAASALTSAPQNYELYYTLALAQSRAGQLSESTATLERGLQASGMPILMGWLAEAQVAEGNLAQAQQTLDSLLEMAGSGSPLPVAIAVAAAALNQHDLALEWLERAADLRDIFIAYGAVLPSFTGLHAHPQFHTLLNRMKLPHPSTHRRHG